MTAFLDFLGNGASGASGRIAPASGKARARGPRGAATGSRPELGELERQERRQPRPLVQRRDGPVVSRRLGEHDRRRRRADAERSGDLEKRTELQHQLHVHGRHEQGSGPHGSVDLTLRLEHVLRADGLRNRRLRRLARFQHTFRRASAGRSAVFGAASATTRSWSHPAFAPTLFPEVWLRCWTEANVFDSTQVQAILTHEFGHTLGAAHSDQFQNANDACDGDEAGAIMTASLDPFRANANLGTDDQDFARWHYGSESDTGNSCGGGPTPTQAHGDADPDAHAHSHGDAHADGPRTRPTRRQARRPRRARPLARRRARRRSPDRPTRRQARRPRRARPPGHRRRFPAASSSPRSPRLPVPRQVGRR